MKTSAQQAPLFPATYLAELGVHDLNKIVALSYDSQPQIVKRTITYRETTTVYVDDMEAGKRIVIRLCVDTKKRGTKRVQDPNGIPRVDVSRLEGYDPVKQLWGTESHTTEYKDASIEDAWPVHQQLESIRDTMVREGPYNWYPSCKSAGKNNSKPA